MKTITVDMHQILGDRPLYDTKLEYLRYVSGMEVDIFSFFANGPVKVGSAGLSLDVFVDDESLPEGVSCESVAETLGVAFGEWFGDFKQLIENSER